MCIVKCNFWTITEKHYLISCSGGFQSKTSMEYLNPNKGDATWKLKNKTENFSDGKFRHCLVALPGNWEENLNDFPF